MKLYCSLFLFCFVCSLGFSQNTVGTIYATSDAYDGYTLFSSRKKTYLINNCGERVNEWTSQYATIGVVYLLEDGSILRSGTLSNSSINFGGVSGRIEKFDWEGNLIWEFEYSDNNKSLHHDFHPLPNGNILALAVTKLSNQQAIDLGRDPEKLVLNLYNEQIIEIEPQGSVGGNIVWQWNVKDHLIQDFDNLKPNYGISSDHPERLDVNYLNENPPIANWLHFNSIQYNETLSQIILSSRLLSEIYVIEHTSTSGIAASNTGGLYNKGGDFLYRWGNPEAYDLGDASTQKLFGQHFPHWIPIGLPNAGKLLIFNNGFGRIPSFSEVYMITPPMTENGFYSMIDSQAFGPTQADYIYYNSQVPENFYSPIVSSAQMLPNGNILICDGDSGHFFEVDENNDTVWEYISPVVSTGVLSQGETPSGNLVFKAIKYSMDYAAFNGKDLTPGLPVELNPDISACELLSVDDGAVNDLTIYPIPANNTITIDSALEIIDVTFYDTLGHLVKMKTGVKRISEIDVSNLSKGLYYMIINLGNTRVTKKIIKS